MSAECSKHGTDLLYSDGGTVPDYCPSCEVDRLRAISQEVNEPIWRVTIVDGEERVELVRCENCARAQILVDALRRIDEGRVAGMIASHMARIANSALAEWERLAVTERDLK